MIQAHTPKTETSPIIPKRLSLVASSLIFLTGCTVSSITPDDEVTVCNADNSTTIKATFHEEAPSYAEKTDPLLLSSLLEDRAKDIQRNDKRESETNIRYRNQVIGLGQIICRSPEDPSVFYLTPEGATLSREFIS